MDEEAIRAIVRDEIEEALLKEGGLYDHARTAAVNALIQMGLAHPKAGGKPN